ncbi:calpastatin [Mycobacterium sp. WY10]|nr:calpastatin [Mycobacterium sp. WY10]
MDPFNLQRFVDAQDRVYDQVLAELRAGAKRSHWIWFIFPQLATLGSSSTAKLFGIDSLAEAKTYLAHPVLGTRLRECARLVTAIDGRSVDDIFGWPDNLKVRSSMTLFAQATDDNADFLAVLDKFYGGQQDPRTLESL